MPYSLRIVCGFFNVLQLFKGCETGPLAYSPYPRRLESLTICWCNYKGSTFYSVISRPWVLVQLELNSWLPASQPNAQQLSHRFEVTNIMVTKSPNISQCTLTSPHWINHILLTLTGADKNYRKTPVWIHRPDASTGPSHCFEGVTYQHVHESEDPAKWNNNIQLFPKGELNGSGYNYTEMGSVEVYIHRSSPWGG